MYFADLEALQFEVSMVCLVIMCVSRHTLIINTSQARFAFA